MLNYEYVSSSGLAIGLDGPFTYIGEAHDVRGREWSCEIGSRSIASPSRKARKVSVDAVFTDLAEADMLCEVADDDVRRGACGVIMRRDGWGQRAAIVSQAPTLVRGNLLKARLGIVLLDGVWSRPVATSFSPSPDGGGEFLDLPHDQPYDLAAPPEPSFVDVGGLAPLRARIVVYGPANSPYVKIAGNTYEVKCSVPAGGYLVVDPMTEPKRAYVVDAHGNETDVMASATRGTGEGGGSYIFERVPPGFHEVSWPRTFGFDLVLYEERGELPWTW